VGGIDLVAAIKARDELDKIHDLRVLWSKSSQQASHQLQPSNESGERHCSSLLTLKCKHLHSTSLNAFQSKSTMEKMQECSNEASHIVKLTREDMVLHPRQLKQQPFKLWKLKKSQVIDQLGGEKGLDLIGTIASTTIDEENTELLTPQVSLLLLH